MRVGDLVLSPIQLHKAMKQLAAICAKHRSAIYALADHASGSECGAVKHDGAKRHLLRDKVAKKHSVTLIVGMALQAEWQGAQK